MPAVDLQNAEQLKKYTQFIRTSPFATTTQDIAWSEVKDNWTPLYVYLEENDEIIAAMSILMVKNVDDKYFAYCCKGPVCDPTDVALVSRLVEEAKVALEPYGAHVLRFDPEVVYDEALQKQYEAAGFVVRGRNVGSHDTVQPRLNMVLMLKGKTEEEVLQSFHSKTRYNIRLAQRKGVTVDYANNEEYVKAFYRLYETMSQRHGISYRPYEYFARMAQAYGDYARIYIARYEGEAIATGFEVAYGDKAWYVYGGSANEHRNVMAPYLIQWEMIKWAIEEGKDRYDFGGVFELDDSDGLYRFKRGFCHEDQYTEYLGEIDCVLDAAAYEKFTSK